MALAGRDETRLSTDIWTHDDACRIGSCFMILQNSSCFLPLHNIRGREEMHAERLEEHAIFCCELEGWMTHCTET